MRSPRGKALLLLLLFAVLAAACTSGDDDAPEQPAAPGTSAPAAGLSDEEIRAAAQRWIDTESGLTDMLREEIFFESLRRAGKVAHVKYIQAHGGVAVRGAQFIVHVLEDGSVQGASNSLITALPADDATEELTQAQASEIAVRSVTGTVAGEPRVESTWLQSGDVLRLGWQVFVTTSEPAENWAVVVDATDGTVLSVETLSSKGLHDGATGMRRAHPQVVSACQPAPAPSACVYPVDPIFAAGGPVSPVEADAHLEPVTLEELTDPASGRLEGRYAIVVAPATPSIQQSDLVWGTEGRTSDDFAAGMTYHWVTYTQQLIAELGFPIHGDDPVEINAIDSTAGNRDNAEYLFFDDLINMGVDSNGVRSAEDASVIIHEYGHGILQSAVPFILTPEGGALHEATGDIIAMLTTLEYRNADPACLSFWYISQGDCLRRVDTDRTYPTDIARQPHRDGQIFSGAVYDVLEALLTDAGLSIDQCTDRETNPCDAVRDRVLATFLASLGYLTPEVTLNDAAAAFLLADEAQFDGTAAAIITPAFAGHGLSTTDAPTTGNDGNTGGGDRPLASLSIDIQHEHRGDLEATVTIVDGQGDALCEGTLAEPDPTDAETSLAGTIDLSDDPCAQFLPPSPQQRWVLHVTDGAAGDVGQVVSFSVTDGVDPYPAPALPAPIPDGDITGLDIVIDGTGSETSGPETDEPVRKNPVPPGSGGVTASIAITHPRVGDLQILAGVFNENDLIVCSVLALSPDPQATGANVAGDIDLSSCARHYPPTPQREWFLRVIDTAAQDEGTIDAVTITGPDGREYSLNEPVPIPDGDLEGVTLVEDGSGR